MTGLPGVPRCSWWTPWHVPDKLLQARARCARLMPAALLYLLLRAGFRSSSGSFPKCGRRLSATRVQLIQSNSYAGVEAHKVFKLFSDLSVSTEYSFVLIFSIWEAKNFWKTKTVLRTMSLWLSIPANKSLSSDTLLHQIRSKMLIRSKIGPNHIWL